MLGLSAAASAVSAEWRRSWDGLNGLVIPACQSAWRMYLDSLEGSAALPVCGLGKTSSSLPLYGGLLPPVGEHCGGARPERDCAAGGPAFRGGYLASDERLPYV